MQEGQAVEAGQEIADDLMDKLSVSKDCVTRCTCFRW